MHDIERSLSNIERIVVDPDFALMLKTVETLNALFLDGPQREETALKHVHDLNELWRRNGFHGRAVYVTGFIHAGGEYGDLSLVSLTDATYFTNQRVVSDGFFLSVRINEQAMAEDGEEAAAVQQIVMRGSTLIDDSSGIDGKTHVNCAIDVVTAQVTYPEMTPGRAAAWLEEYHEDVKTEIDAILLNSEDECEALLALKETSIDASTMTKNERKELIQYLCDWLVGEVVFDQHYPYSVAVNGELEIFNPYTLQRDVTAVSDVLSIHAKEIAIGYNKEKKALSFGLSTEIITGPREVSRPTHIPLDLIEDIVKV